MKILSCLEKDKNFWFLITTLFAFFLLRLPSLFEPYWYGDEGIYQVVGMAAKEGRLLYRDIWDNKPPLLYLIYAIFNSDQFTVRFASLISGILAVIAFFFLAKKLFNQKITYLTTSFFALLFALPLIEGNIANAENFMLLPIISSALLIFKSVQLKTPSKFSILSPREAGNFQFFIAGLLLSFAFLIKIVAIFDLGAILIFLFVLSVSFEKGVFKKEIVVFLKSILPLVFGFLLLPILTAIFFLSKGAFFDFLNAVFFQMFGYVSYGNQFFIPQGLLITKMILLTIFTFLIYQRKNKIEVGSLFILIWLGFSLFNALFAQRPYTHYLLVLLPSFSLFLGLIFWHKKYQKITILLFFILLFFLQKNFWIYEKNLSYYQNFMAFIINKKSLSSYQKFFDKQTPLDYDLASFIKTHTNKKDNIFIWGNNAQVYKMTNRLPPGRYTVAYHITASKKTLLETEKALQKARPKYIVVTSLSNPFPYKLRGYTNRFSINESIIYERIF